MTVHELAVAKKRAGGGGVVHERTVEDCTTLITESEKTPNGNLVPLTEVDPKDFGNGLTVVGVNRCIDDPTVVVREISEDDLHYNHNDEPTVPFELDSLTTRYNLNRQDDDVDVIRAVLTT
jgi:hypothetical protein